MTQITILGKIRPYLQGLATGIMGASILLYLLNVSGLLIVSAGDGVNVVHLLHWSVDNLGLSVIPFGLTAIFYIIYLVRLRQLLASDTPSSEDVCAVEEKIDLLMNIFFGIGVIWTAIGMRNALLASLGNMDAETAAQKGAFYILTQLIEGGILVALSTTIVGGIGGYLMRIIKSWAAGPGLTRFVELHYQKEQLAVLDRLDLIAGTLDKIKLNKAGLTGSPLPEDMNIKG